MHLEIELKMKLNNDRADLSSVVIPRIQKLAVKNSIPAKFLQEDTYYSFPNGENARIRVKTSIPQDVLGFDTLSDDVQTILTVKQRSRICKRVDNLFTEVVPSIECNKEYEETVCGGKNLPQMLELLGGKRTVTKTKRTMIWELPKELAYGSGAAPHIEVSSVDDLGTYIEIEMLLQDQSDQAVTFASKTIQHIEDALDLGNYAKVSTKSYSAELQQHKHQQ